MSYSDLYAKIIQKLDSGDYITSCEIRDLLREFDDLRTKLDLVLATTERLRQRPSVTTTGGSDIDLTPNAPALTVDLESEPHRIKTTGE